ncbi:MAG: hypothetical protein RR494_02735 [Vagococcus sp.]|uniref:hypothetical protein n=1 Tax=Vagococcus sp. TaxID=1933889 RepID=UPI002FC752C6
MSLTDKEIALELTKITVEHFNRRVDNKGQQSFIDEKHVEHYYKTFYKSVTSLDKGAK